MNAWHQLHGRCLSVGVTTTITALATALLPASRAGAALITNLTNGDFELRSGTHAAVIDTPAPDSWLGGKQTTPAGFDARRWNLDSFAAPTVFPTIGGDGALALIATKTGGASWAYQSLGTVGAGDIGDVIDLYIGIGARGTNGVWTGSSFAGVYSGTTGTSLGTLLGIEGGRTITNTVANAKQLTTVHATYTVAPGDLGTELFAVFRVAPITGGGDVTGQTQWVLDNASVHIPEPTACALAACLGVVLLRRRSRLAR